jgi:putative Holliday junction resolvase
MATVATALPRIYHVAAYNEIAHAPSLDSREGASRVLRPNRLQMSPAGRVLALDFGKKRIGLAISDGLGITAQGLPTFARINKRADLAMLGKLIKERGVTQILMGNPLHMSGKESRQSEWTRQFAGELEKHTGIPVKMWDERLTSVEASRVLRSSGIGIEKRAAAVDKLSAVILLQSYLDSAGARVGADKVGEDQAGEER